MNDEELLLIEQAKNGCQIAFEHIYKNHRKLVETTVRMYVKHTSDVDELVNTTFIKVFKKLNLFVTHDSFEKWVKTIAINSCIDHLRRKKREMIFQSVDNEENIIQLKSLTNDPEDDMIEVERNEKLKKALKSLTEKQAKLVDLYYIQGYLYKEIAKKLALPLGTVKSELHRAKLKMKSINNF